MTFKEFYKKWGEVACPEYRGAPYPEFNPAAINESKFSDALRCKDVETNFIEGDGEVDRLEIKWTSQDWDRDGLDDFTSEIMRCLRYIGFKGEVTVDIWERGMRGDDDYSDFIEFEVK